MSALEVTLDPAQLERLGNLIGQAGKDAPAALARALNHAGDKAKTAMTRSLTIQTGLKRGVIVKALKVTRASAGMHIAGLVLGNAGTAIRFTDDQVRAFYGLSTGYVPGRPATDGGGDERAVLDCWRSHGLEKGLHGIAGHLAIDAGNPGEVRQALAIFGNLYCGAELPGDWLEAAPRSVLPISGEPREENGHAFAGLRYDADGVELLLWGGIQCLLPWAGVPKYLGPRGGGELHVVVSRDALLRATQRDPHGLDWPSLAADFRALGGALAG